MQSAFSVGFLSPFMRTFSFPSISQNLQQISKNKQLTPIMQTQQVIIREQIIQNQNYGGIVITVDEPIKNQTETFAFFTYGITGNDMHGSFSVRRRYRDFDLLRIRLAQRWQGIYIPPISGKRSEDNFMHVFKMFGNDETAEVKYAETRKRFLRYFCQGIAIRPYLYYCDLFQIFLRGGPDYQIAIHGCLDKQSSFILQQYENNFKSIIQLTQQMDFNAVITINQEHLKQLKESEENLIKIYRAIYQNVHARDEYVKQFNVCMSTVLPQYEQKYFINHIGNDRKQLILNKNEEFNIKLNDYKVVNQVNPIQLFLQLVSYEIRENKAFIEAIQGRKAAQRKKYDLKQKIDSNQKYMQKIANGGFSFRAMFKSGTKELQLKEIEMKIQILKKQLDCTQKMIVIMIANTNYQLQQYKLRRGKQYGDIFKTVAEKQLVQIKMYTQLLGFTLKE